MKNTKQAYWTGKKMPPREKNFRKRCPRCGAAGPGTHEGSEYSSFKPDQLCKKCSQKARHMKHYFGLSLEEWDRLNEQQGGLCAICYRPQKGGKMLAVDHNHQTGAVRGLLCTACNTTIGQMEEDPQLLRGVIAYLHKNGEQE